MEYTIDCSATHDAKALHRALAQSLAFPDWYGHNLDALYDCLTELENPVHLVLKNWDANTPFSAGFESVFSDAEDCNPDFTVEYA